MRNWSASLRHLVVCLFLLSPVSFAAAAKVHVIAFGKWTSVQTLDADGEDNAKPIKIRALLVDGRVKEYATGAPHEVTDRLFVVRRAFRVNDGLPEDAAPRWQWQRGRMAAGGSRHGPRFRGESAGIRCGIFGGELVSRLRGLLRCVGRWEEIVCDRGAAGAAETDAEKSFIRKGVG